MTGSLVIVSLTLDHNLTDKVAKPKRHLYDQGFSFYVFIIKLNVNWKLWRINNRVKPEKNMLVASHLDCL